MPTLLQINETANSGSHGIIAENIGRLAMAHGWHSVIAYGRWANASQSELIRIGSVFSVYEHGLESRLLDNHGLASRQATKRFVSVIKEMKPTIIHLHNIHGYYINYELLFKFLAASNIPVVWTLHDCWPITGHCSHFDFDNCEKWKIGCHTPCVCKTQYPSSYWLDRSKHNWQIKKDCFTSIKTMRIVPVSNWLEGIIKNSFLGHFPLTVIHNGIDLDVYQPIYDSLETIRSHYGLLGKKVLLGVANVWTNRKGLADFLELRHLLSDEYLIVLVGVNEAQLKRLPKGIVGVQRTQDQHELAQLYSIADVFVNPTYEDNYPTTNLEAMACGTPVLTYNTGGSSEAVTKETGWVVNQGDLSSIVQIINSMDGYSRSKACRERAKACFDKNQCFEAYLKLYEELLNK